MGCSFTLSKAQQDIYSLLIKLNIKLLSYWNSYYSVIKLANLYLTL